MHEAFCRGEGPSLILIPPGQQELYDLTEVEMNRRIRVFLSVGAQLTD